MGLHTRLYRLGAGLMSAILLLLLLAPDSSAQEFKDRESRAGLTIGPGFMGGASMIIESRETQKIKPIFAWRAGVHTTYPLNEVISAGLELGVDNRGTREHYFDNSDLYADTRVTYFSLYPNFVFGGFNLGFNLGFPLSASYTLANGSSIDVSDTDELPLLIEPRIGVTLPLVDVKEGWLSLVFGTGFSFNPLIDYPGPANIVGDWRNVSAHLGMRFEFGIPGTERED